MSCVCSCTSRSSQHASHRRSIQSPQRLTSASAKIFEMPKHNTNPQDLGWTHKGANEQSKVEFYEKDGVKMDYYYTTGTVKTSMDHPSQGKTQMFRRDLSEDQFQSVCQNPRYHTGQGYQTKSSKYYKW